MTTLDIIVNFAISFLAGYLPMFGNKDDVMSHLEKCYKKALGKWNVSQETRELMSDNMLDQLPQLQKYIKDKRKGINPKTKELIVAWLQEIHCDSNCLEYISSFQTDIINYKLDEYFENLKSEILDCNSDVLNALKEQRISIDKIPQKMIEAVSIVENTRKRKLINIYTTQLSSCQYLFMGEIHVVRHEVMDIIKWIQTPDFKKDEDRICMLTGTAGLGKTVVLHDLLEELKFCEGYQAYGIKADQIDFSKEKIDDFITLYIDEFESLTKESVFPVLIIDQIDALSKTLSADRNPITLLDSLINAVVKIKGVRIIVSCRPYDLDFDPILKRYEYRKNIALKPLEYQQVVDVLKHFKRNIPGDKTKLATFISVPNNMQWFLEYGKDDCEVISLQSLMDEMWRLRITEVDTKNKQLSANGLSDCLQRIVQVINDSSSLVCSKKRLERDFSKEISYLISEQVLIQSSDSKYVMFPHQSLADYASARLTFENGQTMADMLEKEHQGLYVRNRVKQYFAYIREADSEAYLNEFKHIIVDDIIGTYRTHIKLLLLSTLAGFDEPSDEEKEFVSRYIIPNNFFRDMFIDAIYNQEWFEFVARHSFISDRLEKGDEEIVLAMRQCTETMMYYHPDVAADFLLSQIRKGDVKWNMKWMHVVNYNPVGSVGVKLIPLYEASMGEDPLHYCKYLEKLAKERYDYVEQKILDYVDINLKKQKTEHEGGTFSYKTVYVDNSAHTLLELLFDKVKEQAAQTYLKVIALVDEVTKYTSKTPFEHQESHAYFTYNSSSYYDNHDNLVHDYLEYARKRAQEQPESVRQTVNDCLNSHQSILFYIGLMIIRANLNAFKEEAQKVLSNKAYLEELDGKLNYQEAMLLKETFPLLDDTEQQEVMAQIINVAPEWENTPMPEFRKYDRPLYHIGRRKQELLSVLPEDYLKNNWPDEWKFLQEKTRELDPPSIKEPYKIHSESGWRALGIDNMRKMPITDMLNAFRKYDGNLGFDKPTRQGNCMNFEALAAENPSKYDSYISTILADDSINREYAAYGISGLKKAEYDIGRIQVLTDDLCQQLLPHINDEKALYAIMDVLRDINYFSERNAMTPIMMEFLLTVTKDYQEDVTEFEGQKTDMDAYNTGINRVRGSAAHQLVKCYRMTKYEDQIFDALGSCVTASPATRSSIILEQAFLNNLNTDKNFKLYLALTQDLAPAVVGVPLSRVHPLLYFISNPYDDELKAYFKKLYAVPESHKMLSQILWITWVRGKAWGEVMLHELLDQSEKAKAYTLQMFQRDDVVKYFGYVRPVAEWCANSEDAEVGRMYDFLMNDLKVLAWNDIVSVIDVYSQGKAFMYAGHNFLELMKEMSGVHAEDVLRWICKFARTEQRGDEHFYHVSSTMSILVAAYNAIRKYDKANQGVETALDTMDMLMEQKEVRRSMKMFLYELDNK